MVNLKESQALGYLERAKNTVDNVKSYTWTDNRGNATSAPSWLDLLSSMLDLESVYLQRLPSKGLSDLAHLTVDATGFPTLNTWLTDLEKLMDEFSLIRASRVQVLTPLIKQLINGSATGIQSESTQLSSVFSKDYPLLEALDRIPLQNKELLQRAYHKWQRNKFPFRYLNKRNRHLGDYLIYSESTGNDMDILGLKYLDCISSKSRTPQMLWINFKLTDSHINLLKWEHEWNIGIGNVTKLTFPRDPRNPERNTGFNGVFEKAYLSTDYSTLSDLQIDNFIDILSQVQNSFEGLKKFINDTLSGQALKPEEVGSRLIVLSSSVDKMIECLPTDYLKMQIKMVWMEALREIDQEVANQQGKIKALLP